MKKYLSVVCAALLVAALLAGCGTGAAQPAAQPAAETPQPAEEAPAQGASPLVGGWAMPDSFDLDEKAGAAFEKAMAELVGVDYTPLACLGSQVVSGVNRAYFCRSRVVYPGALPYYSIVYIYEDLNGAASITGIENITPDGRFDEAAGNGQALAGGWSVPEDDADALAAFESAAAKITDAKYTPVAVMGQQVVSGMNYCLLCRADASGAQPCYCFVQVYRDLQGSAEVMKVTSFSAGETP